MPVSARTYERVALEDPEGFWELHDGCLVRKPDDIMTIEHNVAGYRLNATLIRQLDDKAFEVRINQARARRRTASYFVPDVFVVPTTLVARQRGRPRRLESYEEPLPFVAEIWSPSTGGYDVRTKLPEYQRRGDQEIWLVHPYDRAVNVWRRQPDGSYQETRHTGGRVQLGALHGVSIDLDWLFS